MENSHRIERYLQAVPKAELHVHLEGSIQPTTLLTLAQLETYFSGLSKGRERAQREFGVEMRWVFDIVRDAREEADRRRRAEYTTAVAIECMHDGVVALGLGGIEEGNPPELFARWFEQALSAGLHSTPHAGETVGPSSVWGALLTLGAERIGHGVRSIEDPQLVAHLARQHVPLEVCPHSNLCLGVYGSLDDHPLPRLHAAGVPFSVNSDDPPLFNTTLNHNVSLLHDPFHFSLDTIDETLLNGVRHSFLPQEQKQHMEAAFRTEMTKLRQGLSLVQ